MSDDQLKKILEVQARQDLDQKITQNLRDEVKDSMLVHYHWTGLLQVAPVLINTTGLLYVASVSEDISRIELVEPKPKSWTYLS